MAESPAQPVALGLANVRHAYGAHRAVDDVTLTVAPGEIVCLVGPSGCGKTTLLRIAAGLEPLQEGRVILDGCAVAEPGYVVPPEGRGIGFLFQDYALFPHMTVARNVAFGLDKLPQRERAARVAAMLAKVGMEGYADAYPHQLSGGQQQRVALARALAPHPRAVLLDEPFSGLDVRLREHIRDDTLHVLKDSGAATLMVTHDPEEAMFMADRLAIMRAGRIEQEGEPLDVYMHPATAFVASFFGQVIEIPARVRAGHALTPFGALPAPGFAEGDRVKALIRPEALKLTPAGAGQPVTARARVLSARLLGRSSWVHLSLLPPEPGMASAGYDGVPPGFHFHARVPGRFLPRDGEEFSVGVDPSQAFVFAADAAAPSSASAGVAAGG